LRIIIPVILWSEDFVYIKSTIQGGGWCNNITSCFKRAQTRLGSSVYMAGKLAFSGILGDNQTQNPGSFVLFPSSIEPYVITVPLLTDSQE